jgi:hypothetical protein
MNRGRVGEERGSKEMDGCPLTHTTDGRKLKARTSEAVFVGIAEQLKAYWIYWANQHRVSVK